MSFADLIPIVQLALTGAGVVLWALYTRIRKDVDELKSWKDVEKGKLLEHERLHVTAAIDTQEETLRLLDRLSERLDGAA